MTRPLTAVDINTDTFETLINKTNDLVSVVNSAAVTVNTGGGDITSGNAFVNGFFGANTLVTTNIRAGNVSVSGALLTIQTNSSFLDSTIHVGNSTVNVVALKTGLIVANSSNSLVANLNGLFVSNNTTNTVITDQLVSVANSTSSANLNSGGLISGTVVINSTAIAIDSVSVVNSSALTIGSNVTLTTSVLNIGNSTVNTVINSSSISTNAFSVNTLNVASIAVGANVNLTATNITVGNSTVNASVNATSVRIANSTSNITIRVPTTTEANGSYYLNGNGSWVVVTSGNTGISSPGGANTEVQFNDSGTLAGNSNFTYNNTTRTITVGNTVVSNNTTTNNVIIQNNLITAINFTTSGTSQQTVDQIALATYRSTEYLVSIKDNAANGYQVSKMLVIHDGTTSYITEYGIMSTNSSLGVFASDISGANVRLLFTPTSSNTTIRLVRTSIVV